MNTNLLKVLDVILSSLFLGLKVTPLLELGKAQTSQCNRKHGGKRREESLKKEIT